MMGGLTKYERCPEATDLEIYLHSMSIDAIIYYGVDYMLAAAKALNAILVPSDIDPARALDDNERYKVVWSVLNALRAHDDRFNATVNKIELNRKRARTNSGKPT